MPLTFKPSRCIKASLYIPKIIPNLPTTRGFRMKPVYQYMALFINFSPTSSHFHPLQVENCDSNSRLVVDEDDNGKFKLDRVNLKSTQIVCQSINTPCKKSRWKCVIDHTFVSTCILCTQSTINNHIVS